MPPARPKIEEIEHVLAATSAGPLREWLATHAEAGLSWRELADRLSAETGIAVSQEILHRYYRHDPGVIRARAVAAQTREMARAIPADRGEAG